MRATVSGKIVAKESKDWAFNGRTGVSHTLRVRVDGQSEAAAAEKVRVSESQLGQFTEGESVDLPVVIFANTVEVGGVITGAKLSAAVLSEYVHKTPSPAGRH